MGSTSTPVNLKQRKKVSPSRASTTESKKGAGEADEEKIHSEIINDKKNFKIALIVITVLAFVSRFYRITYPSQVVFDEVHFGKFASYYLQRTYFFDLHPPFAKLMIAAVGYLVGYNGDFKFDNIGESYITNNVPYVAYRSLPAILGSLTVPIVFLTMKESGFSLPASILSACLILFDNAHVGETRLILLDAALIISVALSIYCYVRFSKLRDQVFSYGWWKWLVLTGISLSCVISTKYVGVFTFVTIGLAVSIDLWNLLDIRKGLTLKEFSRHFVARTLALIVLPFCIFLFWFWVHFAILTKSGPGDSFMSPEFQETLGDNILAREAKLINYYDIVTLKHKDLGAFLHSHNYHYPLRYDDGRISSQGQQVTTIKEADISNQWQILPPQDFAEDLRKGVPVSGGQTIRLRHVATDTLLLTHDVASPLISTNQEFTTIPMSQAIEKQKDTLFNIKLINGMVEPLKTKAGLLRLVHESTNVALWTHDVQLPDWAFNQYDVNGNKNTLEASNTWFFDEIIDLDDDRKVWIPKEPKSMPFLKKYFELQKQMFAKNNALTNSHPYASTPITWPFLVRGVSFWANQTDREQIYFIGNYFGWWLEIAAIMFFVGIIVLDQLTRRRNNNVLGNRTRSKIYNTIGFFFVGWGAHYFPFFLMGRQLFLHHYLPAHLIAALITGGMADLVFLELEYLEFNRASLRTNRNKSLIIGVSIFIGALIACFVFFAPLTYGTPGLSIEGIQARQWLDVKLHYSK
ncbi:PMT-domain-containing protein [Nadsonia fulvescens var. elongata DSM 6958]|uniref:Dolichyl-phosphate-mannose--protein mannosyltransferase n=1 Tax=Nadsonia fulvescens var. elongata DSM 6958 TaxID=857566 RepID=A0A1E3PFN6_9ASCO|nr:PMT-domain-containing protein [Nadsonia fulvescens var. elongata DSM 6958]